MIVYKMAKYILREPHTTHILVKKEMNWSDEDFIKFLNGDLYLSSDDIYKLARVLGKTTSFFDNYI